MRDVLSRNARRVPSDMHGVGRRTAIAANQQRPARLERLHDGINRVSTDAIAGCRPASARMRSDCSRYSIMLIEPFSVMMQPTGDNSRPEEPTCGFEWQRRRCARFWWVIETIIALHKDS